MANHCQVQTPEKYVIDMLDYIGYHNQLYGKRVLENSCGEGNILCEIVKRYILDARSLAYSDREIVIGLEQDICAYEIDPDCIQKCQERLNKVVAGFGIGEVQWNIKNEDFLKSQEELFSFIIGNPPYITYHDLSDEQKEFLKENFHSCKTGRFDYSYAFIEASLSRLDEHGRMIYLVPYSIQTNKFAQRLRGILGAYLRVVYDYREVKIFPDALTSAIMILCENAQNNAELECYMVNSNQMLKKEKCSLQAKWSLGKRNGQKSLERKRFGDYFEVQNSVATLCNKAFLLKEYTIEQDYYIVGEHRIERQLVKNAASAKSFYKKKSRGTVDKIIFPYKCIEGKVFHYQESEFRQLFPCGYQYLQQFIEELRKRQADQNVLWFEYGRTQAITKVLESKLVLPMVITKKVSVYLAGEEEIPYAGYFVRKKADSHFSLEVAKRILEDDEFYEYVKGCGTPTTLTTYRISVNDIKNFRMREEWLNG